MKAGTAARPTTGWGMREGGLEPPRLAAPDPKSGASAIPPLSRELENIGNQGVLEGRMSAPSGWAATLIRFETR